MITSTRSQDKPEGLRNGESTNLGAKYALSVATSKQTYKLQMEIM